MKHAPHILVLELGSTEAGRGVVEELRKLVPKIVIFGVEKQSSFNDSIFDSVLTTQQDAFFGSYKLESLSSLSMTPELNDLMAPFEGQILNALGLTAVRPTGDYPNPPPGFPVYRDSFDARKDLYNKHCRFWNHIIDFYNIDAVIHENLGQEGYDFAALQVARAKNIPTLVFNISGQFPRVLFVQESERDLGRLDFGKLLKDQIGPSLHPESPDFIRHSTPGIRQTPDAGLKGGGVRVSQYRTSPLQSWLLDRSIYQNNLTLVKVSRSVVGKAGRLFRNPRKSLQTFRRSKRLMQSTRRSMHEERQYAKPLNTARNYVYFPLHFQPETSSSIKGRHFYRLREAAAYLAGKLPDDWILIVKEHPHQFRRLLLREEGFYAQIASIPQVEIVQHTTSNDSLVLGARAVACVSHSSITAFAATNGIPVISLGQSHFREAPGYFCVENSTELEAVIADIAAGMDPPTSSEFENFLKRLEESTFEGEFGDQPDNLTSKEWAHILTVTKQNISQVIQTWLNFRGIIERS